MLFYRIFSSRLRRISSPPKWFIKYLSIGILTFQWTLLLLPIPLPNFKCLIVEHVHYCIGPAVKYEIWRFWSAVQYIIIYYYRYHNVIAFLRGRFVIVKSRRGDIVSQRKGSVVHTHTHTHYNTVIYRGNTTEELLIECFVQVESANFSGFRSGELLNVRWYI